MGLAREGLTRAAVSSSATAASRSPFATSSSASAARVSTSFGRSFTAAVNASSAPGPSPSLSRRSCPSRLQISRRPRRVVAPRERGDQLFVHLLERAPLFAPRVDGDDGGERPLVRRVVLQRRGQRREAHLLVAQPAERHIRLLEATLRLFLQEGRGLGHHPEQLDELLPLSQGFVSRAERGEERGLVRADLRASSSTSTAVENPSPLRRAPPPARRPRSASPLPGASARAGARTTPRAARPSPRAPSSPAPPAIARAPDSAASAFSKLASASRSFPCASFTSATLA